MVLEKHFCGKVAVKAIIVKDGKVLICRGAHSQTRWQIPGGRVNEGEKIGEALKREIFEELGVAVKVARLVEGEQVLRVGDNALVFFFSFEAALDGADDVNLPSGGEIAEVRWIDEGGFGSYEFYPESASVLKSFWAGGRK